jgi:hypothetical protein
MTPQGQAFISLWQQMYVVPSCKCYANRKKRKKKRKQDSLFSQRQQINIYIFKYPMPANQGMAPQH